MGADNWKASEMIFVRRVGDTDDPERTNFPIGMETLNQAIVLLRPWWMPMK